MVMGPTCGMMLADLGAEVDQGRADRRRPHPAAARRGRGLLPDVQPQQEEHRDRPSSQRGRRGRAPAVRHRRCRRARTSSPARWRSTASTTRRCRRRIRELIYVSHKGFLPGPYEHRTALDEVVQMMGGLAYMTGRPGDPLRAGTSVNDIMGGTVRRDRRARRADPARQSPAAAWKCSPRSSRTTCSWSASTCCSSR